MPKINIRLKKQAIKLHLVRSVHLDARPNRARNVIHHLSDIHDFVRSTTDFPFDGARFTACADNRLI